MIDLILYYAAESSYLRIFVISLIPILVAPLIIIYFARYIFVWFDPEGKMTPTRLILFVALVGLITLAVMGLLLYIYLPANTDFRGAMIGVLIIFGLLGAGRLYLIDPNE